MPTEVGIHDFADTGDQVVDGGPAPAVTRGRRLSVNRSAAWYKLRIMHQSRELEIPRDSRCINPVCTNHR